MPARVRNLTKPRRKTFIRQWRDFRGKITQERLVARLADLGVEMSTATLSRIEKGIQPYTQDTLEAIADALQTDAASLLTRDPTDPDAIWSIWDQAGTSERRMIVDLAKTVIKKAG